MNTEFEDRLGAVLRAAADDASAAYPHLDPRAVIDEGHRVVRRRRLGRAAVGLAAVVAVGAGVGALAADREDAAPVPAIQRDIGVVSATLRTGPYQDSDGTQIPGPDHYLVSFDTEPSRSLNVGYFAVDASGTRTLIGRDTVPAGGSTVEWATGEDAPNTLVGVVPSAATDFLVTTARDVPGASRRDVAELPGTGYTAFVTVFDDPVGPPSTTNVLWLGEDGAVRGSDGAEVPWARQGDRTVFVDRLDGEWGAFEADGSMVTRLPDGGGAPLVQPLSDTGKLTGGTASNVFSVLVPAAAQSPTIVYRGDATPSDAAVVTPLSDGSAAVLTARYDQPADRRTSGVTGYSYVVAGQRSTMTVTDAGGLSADGVLSVPAVGGKPGEEVHAGLSSTAASPASEVTFFVIDTAGGVTSARVTAQLSLASGREAAFAEGDGAGYDMAYGLTRARPTQVTPVPDRPGRFSAGTSFRAIPVPGTDLWAVAISLTGTDDHSGVQVTAVHWVDDAGRQHTTPTG